MDRVVGVLGQLVGTATANSLCIAGGAELFSAGLVAKAAHQEIYDCVDLYHKIKKHHVKPHDVVKALPNIRKSVCTTERILHPKIQYDS